MFEAPHPLTQPSVLPRGQVSEVLPSVWRLWAPTIPSTYNLPRRTPLPFAPEPGDSDTTGTEGAIEAQGPLQMERPFVFMESGGMATETNQNSV
jgi:hypothetical protein